MKILDEFKRLPSEKKNGLDKQDARRTKPGTSLKVPAGWKEPATLERAWEGFDALRMRKQA